ncbi:MAG: type II toxin-antitoxin system HicA family toxin [Planctomycetes bacterium]|nr:type II toxin-antitoxin system HicA family toxin [Planctomycetota bacterium]
MPKLPVISGREAGRVFERAGWVFARQKGSHRIYTRVGSRIALSIPDHGEIDRGLLRALIRDAGLSVDEFVALIRG